MSQLSQGAGSKSKKAQAAGSVPPAEPDRTLNVGVKAGKSDAHNHAELALDPAATALGAVEKFTTPMFGKQPATETFQVLAEQSKAAAKGDLTRQREMLSTQAVTLNAVFAEMARRSGCNMGEYLGATETYMRIALKAQAQCRATIEALDRMTSGHVQTVKHVHVSEGGQAVIADEFHQHTGGGKNDDRDGQPHATGTGAAGTGSALPSPDPLGNGVPVPSREGQPAMQDARRQG